MAEHGQELLARWDAFQQSGAVAPEVAPAIAASWQRCAAAGVDAVATSVPCLDKAQFQARLRASAGFVTIMDPVLKLAHPNIVESGVVFCLFDTDGTLLAVVGDSATIDACASAGVRPGACLSEKTAGTNCVAVSLALRGPSSCVGAEHYCRCLHALAGSASPVFDLDGEMIGLIVGFSLAQTGHSKMLHALVMSTVTLVDRHFRMTRNSEIISRYRQITQDLFMPSADASMIVGLQGYVRQVNTRAMRLLDFKSAAQLEEPIDRIAHFEPPLFASACEKQQEVRDMEFEVSTQRDRFIALVDSFPLRRQTRDVVGTLLVFRKKQALAGGEKTRSARYKFDDIVGESEAIQRAKAAAAMAASTNVNVLLEGQSGTGKEMFAQAIHNASDRRRAPFVTIDCTTIPRELTESELFGYRGGAFTGARKGGMIGKFEASHGGTVFLDEIGELSLDVQSELLRVLESRSIVRVGSHEEIPVDIRVIAATNKRLLNEVEAGNFREDLYYRLSVTKISLPSLAESPSDLPKLVEATITQFNERMGCNVKRLAEDIMARMADYAWPGNIRELKNAIEHAVTLCRGEVIQYAHLPDELREALLYRTKPVDRTDPLLDERRAVEKISRDLHKGAKDLYVRALRLANGNVSRAAQSLGVGRATFYRKMALFGIRREDTLR